MNKNGQPTRTKILNIPRYLELLRKTGQSLRTQGVRMTGLRIVKKVQRRLGLVTQASLIARTLTERPSREAIRHQTAWSRAIGYRPPMHIALPLSAHNPQAVRATVQSIKSQTYPHWVLKILCAPEASRRVFKILHRLKRSDPRIQLIHTDSANTPQESLNLALDSSEQSYFGCIQEGDTLSCDALFLVAQSLEQSPELDVVYTDEAHIPLNGKYPEHLILKPDWSPEMLLGYNYLGSLCMIRQTILREVGGFRPRYQEAQEWDLAFRLMEYGCRFKRVPFCRYLRRTNNGVVPQGTSTPNSAANYRAALQSYLDRQGLQAIVETQENGVQRIRWQISDQPKVSIIIPNKNCPELIQSLIHDLRHRTDYSNREIIIVDDKSTDPSVWEFYREQTLAGHIQVVPLDQEFNYSVACNLGASVATGDLLLFLNNDMQVRDPDWLKELVGWALRPEAGVVGTKLVYPNGHLQHAGVVLGLQFATHISHQAPSAEWSPLGTADSYRNYLAVTGACQMVMRSLFEEIGGYDENYELVGSDIAFCLRAWRNGYRTIYTPFASLVHHEESTRGRSLPVEDMERLAREIRDLKLPEDPYLNPNLHGEAIHPTLREPDDISPKEMLKRKLDYYNPPSSDLEVMDWFDDELIQHLMTKWDLSFPLPAYTPTKIADDVHQAAGFILHVLRQRKDVRDQFPLALSEGVQGGFCHWLCSAGLDEYRVPSHAAETICQVFASRPGTQIRQLYGFRPDLRRSFPTAFLPTGQKEFLRWLLHYGRCEHQFRDEEIWWLFLEAAEDPAREFDFTYRVQQDWQRDFPAAMTAFGQDRILNWLKRRHYIDDQILEEIRSRTNPITIEEVRLAYWNSPYWRSKFPNAFRDEADTQHLVEWLREEHTHVSLPHDLPLSVGSQPVHHQLGVNVFGHFCYPSGLQQSARSLVQSLQRENVALSLRDVPGHFTVDDPNREGYLELETYDISLIHIQPIPDVPHPYIPSVYDSTGVEPRADVYRIGYWYWELEDVPVTWKTAAESVQELWAPTTFIANAMKRALSTKVTPMLPGVKIGEVEQVDRRDFGIAQDEFFFLFMFDMKSLMERKNPLGLIEAYRKAFRRDDKAKLLIKVSCGEFNLEELARLKHAASEAGVLIVDEVFSRKKSYGLIQACDCYVSLHRSEGLGLTMAEAMLMSKPVIATNYSGNRDFMAESCSMLVDYRMKPLRGTCPEYVYHIYGEHSSWADPCVEHAASWMRWAYENQDDARSMGGVGQQYATCTLCPENTGRRLRTRIEEIYQDIWNKTASEAMIPAV